MRVINKERIITGIDSVIDRTEYDDGRIVEYYHHVHDVKEWIHTKDLCNNCWTWIRLSTGEEVKFCETHGGKYPDWYQPCHLKYDGVDENGQPKYIKNESQGPMLLWIL